MKRQNELDLFIKKMMQCLFKNNDVSKLRPQLSSIISIGSLSCLKGHRSDIIKVQSSNSELFVDSTDCRIFENRWSKNTLVKKLVGQVSISHQDKPLPQNRSGRNSR
jgi:hypothetical protein